VFASNTAAVWVGRGKRAGTRGHHTWSPTRWWSGCLACAARRNAVQHSAARVEAGAPARADTIRGAGGRGRHAITRKHHTRLPYPVWDRRGATQCSAARAEAGALASASTIRSAGVQGRRSSACRHHTSAARSSASRRGATQCSAARVEAGALASANTIRSAGVRGRRSSACGCYVRLGDSLAIAQYITLTVNTSLQFAKRKQVQYVWSVNRSRSKVSQRLALNNSQDLILEYPD
jgi:hypothetical protein